MINAPNIACKSHYHSRGKKKYDSISFALAPPLFIKKRSCAVVLSTIVIGGGNGGAPGARAPPWNHHTVLCPPCCLDIWKAWQTYFRRTRNATSPLWVVRGLLIVFEGTAHFSLLVRMPPKGSSTTLSMHRQMGRGLGARAFVTCRKRVPRMQFAPAHNYFRSSKVK